MSDRERRAREIADEVVKYIKDNNLQHGDRLPTHREMIKLYKASSQTLWRTSDILKARGIISTEPGIGTYVKKES